MKNIAFVYSGKAERLTTLEQNRKVVGNIFSKSKLWEEPINCELDSLKTFSDDLKQYKDDTIENLLFFYTGHGIRRGLKNEKLHLKLDDGTQDIIELIEEMFYVLKEAKQFPKRLSIVLDACYSGKLIRDNISFTGSFEILVASSENQTATEENDNSELSLFSDAFTLAIETLAKRPKEVTLYEISQLIEGSDYSKSSEYSFPRTKNGMMTIVENTMYDLIQNLTDDLKIYFLESGKKLDDLNLYATNLLEFASVRLPSTFDELVKYLFDDYKEVLILILYQLDDTTLNKYIDGLLGVLRKDKETIKGFSSYNVDMYQNRTNLLITLISNGKDTLSAVNVQILEYKRNQVTTSLTPFIVNLNNRSGQITLIDNLEKTMENFARKDVIIEFILPFELMHLNIASWKGSDNRVLRAKIIKRLWLRIEKSRLKGVLKDWQDVWQHYKGRGLSPLCDVMTDEIDYDAFDETPYIRLANIISLNTYNDLVAESGCIVLAPLNNESKDEVNTICNGLSKIALNQLLKESTKQFKKAKVPYLLIWDNPNRLPTKAAEIKNNQYKSVLGT